MRRLLWLLWLAAGTAIAQSDGRMYVAGGALGFEATVDRALAQQSGSGRFFLLVTGDAVRALSVTAPDELVAARRRALGHGAVFLVCQRDIDRQVFSLIDLAPGVVAVRGWPKPGSGELPPGSVHYKDEDPSQLPAGEALRRLRATCS